MASPPPPPPSSSVMVNIGPVAFAVIALPLVTAEVLLVGLPAAGDTGVDRALIHAPLTGESCDMKKTASVYVRVF